MSRYAALFSRLAARRQGAFIPFVVLGDPSPEQSLAVLEALVAGGADALELGLPFSDPVADGPTIQAADLRALEAGTTPARALEIVARFRERHDHPVGLLVYANLVESGGRERFYAHASDSGVDSVLVADVPALEAPPFAAAAEAAGIAPVLIATPNAGDATLARIAALGRGYTYVVTRRGVTGSEAAAQDQAGLLARLTALGAPPAVLGFGISTPEQVRAGLDAGAAGVISGSAVVAQIAAHLDDAAARDRALTSFTQRMKAATLG